MLSKKPYTLIKQFNSQSAHIKFKGPFMGKTVTWNTHFFTLKAYMADKNIKDTKLKQFIDIQADGSGMMKLTIALNVSEINKPNIHKMMIMIKQYKNLSLGRHEYG
jgi:hypothetical protein